MQLQGKAGLIVNADDFGLDHVVNAGIIRAHCQGIVTSATLLANGRAFDEAVALAKQHPTLGVGAHLTLVAGEPVSPRDQVRSLLTPEGEFYANYTQVLARTVQGQIKVHEVECELGNQLRKIKEAGITPTHVDSHQHLHVFPMFLYVIMNLCQQYGITHMRMPAETWKMGQIRQLLTPRAWARNVLSLFSWYAAVQVKNKGFCFPNHFMGMLYGGNLCLEQLAYLLTHVSSGVTEIMCHPADDNAVLTKRFGWPYHWQQELEALTSGETRRLLTERQIGLLSYRELTLWQLGSNG